MSTLRAGNLTNVAGNGLPQLNGVAGSRLTPTAWVNFNGTGTVAVRDSHNVASITDNGTGLYTVNFAVIMDNADFAAVPNGSAPAPATANSAITLDANLPQTSSGFSVRVRQSGGGTYDPDYVSVIVFGGKA